MYHCNCPEVHVAKGLLANFDNSQLGVLASLPGETRDGFCVHCRHAAFWVKKITPQKERVSGCFVNEGYKVSLWK